MTLPKEGLPRPKLPRNFPLFLLITSAQAISFPHQVKAKVTLVNGGYGSGVQTSTAQSDPGPGGDAGVFWVTFLPGVQYLALPGSGGAAQPAGTLAPAVAGGLTSLTAKNGASLTTASAPVFIPGGTNPGSGGVGLGVPGGASLLGTSSTGAGHQYGGGGGSVAGSSGLPGNPGGSGCILLEFING